MRRPYVTETRRGKTTVIGFILGVAALMLLPVRGLAAAPELSASLSSGELRFGAPLSVSGRVGEAGAGLGGVTLALQADAYPFHGFRTVARLASGADGAYAFVGVKLDRNTRLRVVAEGAPAVSSAPLAVTVDPDAAINAASLGAGRTRLSIRIAHTAQGGSRSVSARWFVAARGTRVFRLAAVTPTRELSSGLTYASATIDPPARRFVYRVCLTPTWEPAMGAPSSRGRCPEHDYTVARDVG
jgi:hypothetical protein